MADHLREQTLPTDKADLARYYQQGITPDVVYKAGLENAAEGVRGHTAAEPRRDMHPGLASLLGVDPNRAPTAPSPCRGTTGSATSSGARRQPACSRGS